MLTILHHIVCQLSIHNNAGGTGLSIKHEHQGADDSVRGQLVTEEEKDMEKNLEALDTAMEKWDMKLHWGKTKVRRISKREEGCNVRVNGRDVEAVKQMKYLGTMMNTEGTCEDEIEHRIGAVVRVIGAVRTEVLERRELRIEMKMKVFNGMLVATLLCIWV